MSQRRGYQFPPEFTAEEKIACQSLARMILSQRTSAPSPSPQASIPRNAKETNVIPLASQPLFYAEAGNRYSQWQTHILERVYKNISPRPELDFRREIGQRIQRTPKQVDDWFTNRGKSQDAPPMLPLYCCPRSGKLERLRAEAQQEFYADGSMDVFQHCHLKLVMYFAEAQVMFGAATGIWEV